MKRAFALGLLMAAATAAVPSTASAVAPRKGCWKVNVSISDNPPLSTGDFKWGFTMLKSWCTTRRNGGRMVRGRQSAFCYPKVENGWVVEAGSLSKRSKPYANAFTWSTKCQITFGRNGQSCGSVGFEGGGASGSYESCKGTSEQKFIAFFLNYNAAGQAKAYCLSCENQRLEVSKVTRTQ
jgi:hypothetical protein